MAADVDEYKSVSVGEVHVEMWVLDEGQTCSTVTGKHQTIRVNSDVSVTAKDNSDESVDVFDTGTNNKLKSKSFTIYSGKGKKV